MAMVGICPTNDRSGMLNRRCELDKTVKFGIFSIMLMTLLTQPCVAEHHKEVASG
jgi:hypothetical protein